MTALGVATAVLLLAPGVRAEVPLQIGVGYAFRITDPTIDDRAHGVVGTVAVDGPPVVWGFSGRAEGFVHAWPAGTTRDAPLMLAGGAASATYLFDDTATRALASVGAFGGAVVGADGGSTTTLAFGPIAGLTLRFPVSDGVFVDARVAVPIDVTGTLLPIGTASIGLAIAPDVLIERALRGEGPAAIDLVGTLPHPPLKNSPRRQTAEPVSLRGSIAADAGVPLP